MSRRPPILIAMDAPEHTAERRAVIPEFTVKQAALLAPWIRQTVDDRVDDLPAADRPVDLVEVLA